MTVPPEVWLRGPVPGIQPHLQPVAHTLLQVGEDIPPVVAPLSEDELWARPGGGAAIGYHLVHLTGSLDRLLTYSRGAPLSPEQVEALARERSAYTDRPTTDALMAGLARGIDRALEYLRSIPTEALLVPREVGRKRLPSTTLGLLVHAAEHSARHAGQIVTLGRIVHESPPAQLPEGRPRP